mgnify:CR=1 FL=1
MSASAFLPFSFCRSTCALYSAAKTADRKVEIVADRGINARITREQWQQVCRQMTAGYAAGQYEASTLQALASLHAILAKALPRDPDGAGDLHNELSDKPLLL